MNWIKGWIKKYLGICDIEKKVAKTENRICTHETFVINKMAELKEYTRVDADVGFRGNNTIILTGVYKRQAYVQFYDMGDANFRNLVEQLKYQQDCALIRHIDAPPQFKGVFDL